MKQLSMFVLLAMCLSLPSSLVAQWSDNSTVNTPVSKPAFATSAAAPMASDGAGGFITVWYSAPDYVSPTETRAQRFNSAGVPQWGPRGVSICAAANGQYEPSIISDGAGGAIIAWTDYRNIATTDADIYVQRINAAGTALWTSNGAAVCTATNQQLNPLLVSDGANGAIIGWRDYRIGVSEIYAQRMNSAGARVWALDGIPLTNPTTGQFYLCLMSDGAGGAMTAFSSVGDIVIQRVNGGGTTLWGVDGITICNAPNAQVNPAIASDDSGGAIIAWVDTRVVSDYNLYAQRVNASGLAKWASNGVLFCGAAEGQYEPGLVKDGSGGVIAAWQDFRNASYAETYAQRIGPSGTALWKYDGIKIGSGLASAQPPRIATDGAGGAIIAWPDLRNGDFDMFASRVDGNGLFVWNPTNVPVSTAPYDQAIVSILQDGTGGAFVTWNDNRSGTRDLMAQRIAPNGLLGRGEPVLQAVNDVKNDQGGKLNILWARSPYDVFGENTINGYMILRGVSAAALPAGAAVSRVAGGAELQEAALTQTPGKFYTLPPGISSATTIYWQQIATVSPLQQSSYAYTAVSLADSGAQGLSRQYFAVWAYTNTAFWYSNVDSGYSVDNLAPIPPAGLAATVLSGPQVRLTWDAPTDPDVKSYAVYRSGTSGFTPGPATNVGTSGSTSFTDASLPVGDVFYYKIIASDVHDNASLPSAEAAAPLSTTQQFSVQDKWNMVSVPLVVNDFTKTVLFPTASTSAYAYDLGYTAYGILENGRGYWLKFSSGQSISVTGMVHTADTIAVNAGWNLIGALSTAIPIANVGSIPGGIVAGNFYGYDNAYHVSATIDPGKAYWVKVAQAGQLVLHAGPEAPPSARIRIEDTGELPPPPPDGAVSSAAGMPGEFALAQNYPNPFNPATRIDYALPEAAHVTLTLYNMLGQEVSALVNEVQDAGYRSVQFDAGRLPSGIYTYKLTAGTFTSVKKMVLLK